MESQICTNSVGGHYFLTVMVFIVFAGDSAILSYSYFLTQGNLEMFILQERRRANTLWHSRYTKTTRCCLNGNIMYYCLQHWEQKDY